jgi:hypothetical protein
MAGRASKTLMRNGAVVLASTPDDDGARDGASTRPSLGIELLPGNGSCAREASTTTELPKPIESAPLLLLSYFRGQR